MAAATLAPFPSLRLAADCVALELLTSCARSECRRFGSRDAAGTTFLHAASIISAAIATSNRGQDRRNAQDGTRAGVPDHASRRQQGRRDIPAAQNTRRDVLADQGDHRADSAHGAGVRIGHPRIRKLKAKSISLGTLILHLLLHPAAASGLAIAWRIEGYQGFREELALQVPALRPRCLSMHEWFERTCRSPRQLAELRAQQWTKEAPKITVVMPVYNVREDWLSQAIESVTAQTYPHWELDLR